MQSSTLPSLKVEKVRVVVHTEGAVAPGAQLSQTHWSIYLLVPGGSSVRLNMSTNTTPEEDKGVFNVTHHQYALTNSAVRYWDFTTASDVTAGKFLELIGQKKRNRYRMTSTGVGCRHWVLTVINDFVAAGYISDGNAAQTLAHYIQFNYSRNQQPVALPMRAGSFY